MPRKWIPVPQEWEIDNNPSLQQELDNRRKKANKFFTKFDSDPMHVINYSTTSEFFCRILDYAQIEDKSLAEIISIIERVVTTAEGQGIEHKGVDICDDLIDYLWEFLSTKAGELTSKEKLNIPDLNPDYKTPLDGYMDGWGKYTNKARKQWIRSRLASSGGFEFWGTFWATARQNKFNGVRVPEVLELIEGMADVVVDESGSKRALRLVEVDKPKGKKGKKSKKSKKSNRADNNAS